MGYPDVLCDLWENPNELRNVAADPEYHEVVTRYRLKALDWRMSAQDTTHISSTHERRAKFGIHVLCFRGPWSPLRQKQVRPSKIRRGFAASCVRWDQEQDSSELLGKETEMRRPCVRRLGFPQLEVTYEDIDGMENMLA